MLLLLCVSIYAFHTLNDKTLWVAQLAPIIYLLQAIVFLLLWFGGVFTIRFVGISPFLLILSGQAKYFFIPVKGTSKPTNQTNKQKRKQKKEHIIIKFKTNKKQNKNKKLKEEKKKMTMYKWFKF